MYTNLRSSSNNNYQTGILSAVGIHLPNTELLGCYFHYTQCIYRKTQNLGLVNQYKGNPRFQRTVRKKFSLPFLPPGMVVPLFESFRINSETQQLQQLFPTLDTFFH